MATIHHLAQPGSIATSSEPILDICRTVLHAVDEHTRIQFGVFDHDIGREDEDATPTPYAYPSSSGAPPPAQHGRGTRHRSTSPYPMPEYASFTPYMSPATYLHDDVRQFTSAEDASAHFEYPVAEAEDIAYQGHAYYGRGFMDQGSAQETTQEAVTQVERPIEHHDPTEAEPMQRRKQPVRKKRRPPCGT